MQLEPDSKTSIVGVNYYVLAAMVAGILLFGIANAFEPDIYSQADFFEIVYSLSQFATGIFGLYVAKKYWGSKIFGYAYLALGLAFILEGIGSTIFTIMQILGSPLPYPGPTDFFVVPYFLLLLFHLVSCTWYFKKKLTLRDKLVIIALPLVVNIIYVIGLLYPINIPGSIQEVASEQVVIGGETFKLVPADPVPGSTQQVTVDGVTYNLEPIQPVSEQPADSPVDPVPVVVSNIKVGGVMAHDPEFWPPFFAGLFYNVIATVNLGWAIIAATVYRGSVLGNAWGLLLIGIGLTTIADIIFDFGTLDGSYERFGPEMPIWVFGRMIICYALYIHMKNL